jgi:anaerobic dimethyl sulfoxide reductase subunit C (anchor subunit)
MGGAHFHLSKPLQSFMAVLNFKSSWLSREIVFNILFLFTITSLLYLTNFQSHHRRLIDLLGWLAILLGCGMIFSMASIYLIPTQVAWNSTSVVISFYITAIMLGGMTIACLMILDLKFAEIKGSQDIALRMQVIRYSFAWLTGLTLLLMIVTIIIIYIQVHLLAEGDKIARTSLRLLLELYMPLFVGRQVFLLFAPVSMLIAVYRMYRAKLMPQDLMMPIYISCLMTIVGEILGRFLFYATHIRVGI